MLFMLVSIPKWSDFSKLKEKLKITSIRVSIPKWSDFSPDLAGICIIFDEFQSQNGLILVGLTKFKGTSKYPFQSQNGLILVVLTLTGSAPPLKFQSQNGLILVQGPI